MLVSDRRGLSDIVGYAFMFGLIVLGVAIVSTVGIAQLQDARDTEQVRSSEQAMVELGATFEDVYRGTDPTRSAQLSLSSGTLSLERTSLTVRLSEPGVTVSRQIRVLALEHAIHGTTITYENGAVIRESTGTLRREPPVRCVPDDLVLVTVVNMTTGDSLYFGAGSDEVSVWTGPELPNETGRVGETGSEGVVGLNATRVESTHLYPNETRADGTASNLTLDVADTAYAAQWARYLKGTGWVENTSTAAPYDYDCPDVDNVAVRTVTVEVSLPDR